MSVELLHTFSWTGEGVEVNLLGSFDGWSSPRPMARNGEVFEVTIPLSAGRYEYKFEVDGQYKHDPQKRMTQDGYGGWNNICEVTRHQAASTCQVMDSDAIATRNKDAISGQANNDAGGTIMQKACSTPDRAKSDILSQTSEHSVSPPMPVLVKKRPPAYTIKLTCLPKATSITGLLQLLQLHGKLVNQPMIKGTTNRYAWVNYDSLEAAENAVHHLDGYCLDGQNIKARLKKPRSPLHSVSSDTSIEAPIDSSIATEVDEVQRGPSPHKDQAVLNFTQGTQDPLSRSKAPIESSVDKVVDEVQSLTLKAFSPRKDQAVLNFTHGTPDPLSQSEAVPIENCVDKVVDEVQTQNVLSPHKDEAMLNFTRGVPDSFSQSGAPIIESSVDKVVDKVQTPEALSPHKDQAVLNFTTCDTPDLLSWSQCSSSTREDLFLRVNYARETTNFETQERMAKLSAERDKIKIKNCPLHLVSILQEQKKSLSHEIAEIEERQIEFNIFCEKMVKASQFSPVDKLEASFMRECTRFNKGLPIYSHRQNILSMIKDNQVSILTAETGSGKSTQLAQYLYEDGVADSGIIVCTQPRKVAAMSLAKYVSSEMLSDPGTLIGYKTGIRGSYSQGTKVLYMTDHTLLNECVQDSAFSKYSCLIVDEAHERSLYTDVLLAFIKRCLPNRPELRVVITSATIDPKSFINYFGQDCPVKSIPGRAFPVDVEYSPVDTRQSISKRVAPYVTGAIDLANTLQKNEPPGDILVFLTSPGEVEQACQQLELKVKRNATVLPLHGKLQPDDQQKVFNNYPQRKIIFSTNVAETSITIPGIKYIVDCGLAKELCFDAKKNMNSLEVRPISKSSAEQRKGRAGRTSAGKCYRLYTEETYEGMSERMVPEILRVSLAGTVLKLHELGIRDVLLFDFIEKPDKTALKHAVATLEFLEAVDDGRLTTVGKSMAALPIDPRLAKIILDGVSQEVGSESITAAAISSLAGTLFFRGGTEEMKEQSDLLKSTFCDPHGDQLTDFKAYCQWVNCLPKDRTAWSVKNSINAKSMRVVHETIRDLTEIVSKQLKLPVSSAKVSFDKAFKKLPKLYFRAFANNLCAFLGHEKIGYFNPNLPDEKLVVFPGSSLCKLNLQPKLLVYEKTLKTSQHFLLQTLPVEEEWVQEALMSGLLAYHPTSYEQFKKLAVESFTTSGLGDSVLKIVVHKQRKILEQASTSLQQVQFVATPERGILKVFVQEHFVELLKNHLLMYIESIKEKLKNFCLEAGITSDGDNVRVLIGNGGSITRVLMPHQYRSLCAKGPVEGTWDKELIDKLKVCGDIQTNPYDEAVCAVKSFQKEKRLWVTFHHPEDAGRANALALPLNVTLTPQVARASSGVSPTSLSVKIEWNRRDRKNFVNIDFHTPHLSGILSTLSLSAAQIAGSIIRFRQSKHNNSHIYAANVPAHLSEVQVRNAFDQILTLLGYSRETYTVVFAYSQPYETSAEELELLEEQLHSLLAPSVSREKYNLKLQFPQNFHKVFMAYVNFYGFDEGMTALSSLEDNQINHRPIRVSRLLSSNITYSPTLYKAMEKSIQNATESIKVEYSSVKVKTSLNTKTQGAAVVRIESQDPPQFIAALKRLKSILQPAVIQCTNQVRFEYMRSKRCEQDIVRVQQISSTVIQRDFRTKCIKIYGSKDNVTEAKRVFDTCLAFCHHTNYYEFELKESGRPAGLLKHLITTYGIDLNLLMKLKGVEMARVDIRKQKLVVFASEVGYQSIVEVIDQFTRENSTKSTLIPSTEVECSACYTPIDELENTYRLEYCGHAYHYECIEAQLAPNAITIPIQCAAEGCSTPFVWKDFENLQSKKNFDPRTVITESIRVFTGANQELVHNCPTPDCGMVYAVTDERGCFLCSHCSELTCTKCHKPFHTGLTCSQNQLTNNPDESLQQWLREDTINRKLCPKCGSPIEKNQGCAHIHCIQCKAHICWHCLAYFETSGDCYGHLGSTHGGFM